MFETKSSRFRCSIDHSVVEHRMELTRQQREKEYEEKKMKFLCEWDMRE